MRLIITRDMPARVLERARAQFDVTLRADDTIPSPEDLAGYVRDYDAVLCTLGDMFTPEVFHAAGPSPRAKILANFGVGYNHIDVSAARAAGITVTNTPGAVTAATADIAISLMLMAARRLGEGERLLRDGQWQGWRPTQMLGQHISGKRLGIIGMGRIGRAIAKRAHYGFDMEIIFHNRRQIDAGLPARQADMAEVLGADVVVVAVPGGPSTHHLIDADAFARMPAHGVFINISRGDVVDEAALIAALQSRQIAAAGLDVYEFEPHVSPALMACENAVLLPHLGTACLEVREAMGMMALDNLQAYRAGLPLPNAVS